MRYGTLVRFLFLVFLDRVLGSLDCEIRIVVRCLRIGFAPLRMRYGGLFRFLFLVFLDRVLGSLDCEIRILIGVSVD